MTAVEDDVTLDLTSIRVGNEIRVLHPDVDSPDLLAPVDTPMNAQTKLEQLLKNAIVDPYDSDEQIRQYENQWKLLKKERNEEGKCDTHPRWSRSNKGKDTFVPRITCYEDKNLPFHLKRTQFPVKLAFAISINKAQGQSFGRVGLYLPEDVFAHGQTYVALSRARSKNELFIKSTSERLFNVVYKEIL
uniref:ATP-dependent DNA helicase n=1 Tax=Caenorhabditis japonica TaxID=281687 RepID=A0A8R1E9L8_CAEJA